MFWKNKQKTYKWIDNYNFMSKNGIYCFIYFACWEKGSGALLVCRFWMWMQMWADYYYTIMHTLFKFSDGELFDAGS